MNDYQFHSRRSFLEKAGLGCGSLALTNLLHQQGVIAAEKPQNPLASAAPEFSPKAKAVIWLFQTGSPSQVDTFDYKPVLQKRSGEKLAGADPKTGFFTTTGNCLGSPFEFKQHGESGSWVFGDFAQHGASRRRHGPFIYSCYSQSNNHTPAMLEANSGMIRQGHPSMGSWLTYGLGSDNGNLPAYVVMHGTKPRGGDPIWSSGFLPSVYQATALDPRKPKPIQNLDRHEHFNDGQQRSLPRCASPKRISGIPTTGRLKAIWRRDWSRSN